MDETIPVLNTIKDQMIDFVTNGKTPKYIFLGSESYKSLIAELGIENLQNSYSNIDGIETLWGLEIFEKKAYLKYVLVG